MAENTIRMLLKLLNYKALKETQAQKVKMESKGQKVSHYDLKN